MLSFVLNEILLSGSCWVHNGRLFYLLSTVVHPARELKRDLAKDESERLEYSSSILTYY